MLLRRPMKLLMLSATRLYVNKQFSNIQRKLKWRRCLEILLMVKLNFTNRCVVHPWLKNIIKLLTILSIGYGRMGKNHTRNTTYTRGRLVTIGLFLYFFAIFLNYCTFWYIIVIVDHRNVLLCSLFPLFSRYFFGWFLDCERKLEADVRIRCRRVKSWMLR